MESVAEDCDLSSERTNHLRIQQLLLLIRAVTRIVLVIWTLRSTRNRASRSYPALFLSDQYSKCPQLLSKRTHFNNFYESSFQQQKGGITKQTNNNKTDAEEKDVVF